MLSAGGSIRKAELPDVPTRQWVRGPQPTDQGAMLVTEISAELHHGATTAVDLGCLGQ